jgi:NAD(P)-dependent dehydrogenase (short-subunit alcohol dehydrogenase family)
MKLSDHPRVVVTGAGSGLGAAFCDLLAGRGARVLAADLDLAAAQATAARCGKDTHAVACDVTKLDQVERLATDADRLLGGVDLVVNNAGVAVVGTVGEVSMADWRWVMDVNVWGVIHGCHVFAPRLRAQKRGHILNVGSAAGLLSPPHMAPYNVSKAAVVALSETLYADLAGDGVGVTVLCPTFIKTNLVRSMRTSDQSLPRAGQRLLDAGTMTAAQVVAAALDGVERGALHVTPQLDGRWLWRLKRLAPRTFHALSPKIVDRVVAKLSRA